MKGESEETRSDSRKEWHLSATEANQMPSFQISDIFDKSLIYIVSLLSHIVNAFTIQWTNREK